MKEPAIILLAAGSSSRLGQSKQLVSFRGESLLLRATTLALQSGMLAMVVLGANQKAHRDEIAKLPVDVVLNEDWENGMGSSLKTGLAYLLKHAPETEAIIVMVCDQPLLTSEHLKKLRATYRETKKEIIASHYAGTEGVPVLFHKSIFQDILELPDDQGAKKIIARHAEKTVSVDFPDGAFDIDTEEDLKELKIKNEGMNE